MLFTYTCTTHFLPHHVDFFHSFFFISSFHYNTVTLLHISNPTLHTSYKGAPVVEVRTNKVWQILTSRNEIWSLSLHKLKGGLREKWEGNIKVGLKELNRGRDSAVGIATRYGLDGRGIESWWWRDFPHPSRPALGPTQPPVQWVPCLSRW